MRQQFQNAQIFTSDEVRDLRNYVCRTYAFDSSRKQAAIECFSDLVDAITGAYNADEKGRAAAIERAKTTFVEEFGGRNGLANRPTARGTADQIADEIAGHANARTL